MPRRFGISAPRNFVSEVALDRQLRAAVELAVGHAEC